MLVINVFGVKGDSGWYITDLKNFKWWNFPPPLYGMHVAINKNKIKVGHTAVNS